MKKEPIQSRIDLLPLLAGMFFLSLGFVFYGAERSMLSGPCRIFGFSPIQTLAAIQESLFFTCFKNNFPTFIHTFAFSLISAAFFPSGKKGVLFICLSWVVINATFECMQGYPAFMADVIPVEFEGAPFLAQARHFFTSGIFDLQDILAALLGGLCAFGLLFLRGARKNEYKNAIDF